MDSHNVWDSILARVETKINRHSFYTWFKPSSFMSETGDLVRVRVPNPVFRDWLTKHYAGLINEALAELDRPMVQIEFVAEDAVGGADADGGRSGAANPPEEAEEAEAALLRAGAAAGYGALPPDAAPGVGLNLRYTFDTFVVGPSQPVRRTRPRARWPRRRRASYNPLFIYGGVGLGKTHLMHAIGHHVLEHNPHVAADLHLLRAVHERDDQRDPARPRCSSSASGTASVDVLLIDDIQFLAGKERTQEEFFHTFNALYDAQKQIVLTSDCPPHEIPALEERLRSRFEWGLIADIQPPDLETQGRHPQEEGRGRERAACRTTSRSSSRRTIKSNVRELEGSLIRLIAYASLTGREVSIGLAQDVLQERPRPGRARA